jgi:hypothetical protein
MISMNSSTQVFAILQLRCENFKSLIRPDMDVVENTNIIVTDFNIFANK